MIQNEMLYPVMHLMQKKILELSRVTNLKELSLREIGEKIGEKHAQSVRHHLEQLKKKGFLRVEKGGHSIVPTDQASQLSDFLSIPILGNASCGPAQALAEENIEGYLHVSKNTIPHYKPKLTFAIKPVGNSMNNAQIGQEKLCLEEGDYAIIEMKTGGVSDFKNKYVLSVIDGMSNIKKFTYDEKTKRIILKSESKQDCPPIVIHEYDLQEYMVNGIVRTVIKR